MSEWNKPRETHKKYEQIHLPSDPRPALGGWAEGGYFCYCIECQCHFIGDKRAYMCADCAYKVKP